MQRRERGERWKSDPFKTALPGQGLVNGLWRGMEFVMSEQVDHIIEVAWTRPLRESTHLLGENLFVAVAPRHDRAVWSAEYGCETGRSTGGKTSISSEVRSSLILGRSPDSGAIGPR